MIQINCTIQGNILSASIVLDGTISIPGTLESSTRIIFKLNDIYVNKSAKFVDGKGNVLYNNYTTPSSPGAYEGPILVEYNSVQPLKISRDQFLLPDGSNYNWKGNIDFMLFHRSLDGIAIEPLLAQRYAAGSRSITTLGMASFIEDFNPRNYPSYFPHIKPFANALKAAGFYWNPIVFADAQILYPSKSDQIDFLNRFSSEISGLDWVNGSLANEYNKNGIDPSIFSKPTGNLWSRGSNTSDAAPFTPGWDFKEWHPRRDWPKVLFGNDDAWYVKEGIDADNHMLDYPMPSIIGEPIGFWNQNVPGRRSNDPNLARVIGGTSIYFARGGNFMSEQGLRCEMWDTITYNCAVEFFKAINQT